jgi:hypothetical protein
VIVKLDVGVVAKLRTPAAEYASAEEPASTTWPDALPAVTPAEVSVIEPEAPEIWTAALPDPPLIAADAPDAAIDTVDEPAVIVKVPWIEPSDPSESVARPDTALQGVEVPAGCESVTTTEPDPVFTVAGPTLPALS